jgi:predicted GNAT family acetyltransferase
MLRLTDRDRVKILAYVSVEPEFNIFFIGDIENFGVDCPEVSVYAGGENDRWDCLVLRYINDYVVYSRDNLYDAAAVAGFLRAQQNAGMISGKLSSVALLEPYFPERKLRSTILTKCTGVLKSFPAPREIDIRMLTPDDAEAIVDLMFQIDEFSSTYTNRDESIRKQKISLSHGSTCCGAFEGGTLVASAQTTAENSLSAMVVGVATHPDRRGRGYASAVVSQLCRDAFTKGKRFLCLFYDNPTAGRIYNKVGFAPIGDYALFK